MRKKQMLMASALFSLAFAASAQTTSERQVMDALKQDNAAFTFTESQLGEDDDMTQDVIMVGSNSNVYTSGIGYLWSPARFKYRAYDSRYNDIYMNGVKVNNGENGRFNYSTIGGINDATRNIDASSPFESNNFSLAGLGGSNNYNFRAGSFGTGHKITLSGANRNYTTRVMYGYGTGMTRKGWAFYGTVGYRWANMQTSNVEGNFYNSLSYFLSLQKQLGERHSLNLATWGNPTERAQQGASTDEAYWLANNRLYNPYWGYQNGEKRNSRIVENYEPSALLTWDFQINDNMKLTTSAFAKYAMYSSTRLGYDGGQSPAPDYYKNFPSYHYDVFGVGNGQADYNSYWNTYNYWTSDKRNRQINWDQLYQTNLGKNAYGMDASYWVEKKHNNHLATNLASTFEWNTSKTSKLNAGLQLASNKAMHYKTMDDLLGAQYFHNTNTYVNNKYGQGAPEVEYDMRNAGKLVKKGDRMHYDYDIYSQSADLWAAYIKDKGISHNFVTAKIGGSQMWRDGHMQYGLAKDNSYGKSGTARFLYGGFKMGTNLNLGHGNALVMGVGYETRAPQAYVSFIAPEVNNDFVPNLKNEKIFSAELGYALNIKWLRLNVNAYYSHTYDVSEWQAFYFDDFSNSEENTSGFRYMSLTGITKDYYGVELGAKFKVTSNLDINVMGTMSEAKYDGLANVNMLESNTGIPRFGGLANVDNVREGGTPLAVGSLGLNYRYRGWFFNVNGNYYDRIYLSYSPYQRMSNGTTNDGKPAFPVYDQAKGDGGFMLDASIGRNFRIAGHPLNVNLMLTNITNNTGISTGGYEQARSDKKASGSPKEYSYKNNPKKYYAQGFNFMLNLNYRF